MEVETDYEPCVLPKRTRHPQRCPECGKVFVPVGKCQACCSPECQRERVRKHNHAYYIAHHVGVPLESRKCAVCGKEFSTRNPAQKYCSRRCKAESERVQKREWNRANRSKSVISAPPTFAEERKQRAEERKARAERLARRDLEFAAAHVPVSVTVAKGVRTESRGNCPPGTRCGGITTFFQPIDRLIFKPYDVDSVNSSRRRRKQRSA